MIKLPGYLKIYLIGLLIFVFASFVFKSIFLPLHINDDSINFRRVLALIGLAIISMAIWTVVVAIMLIMSL